MTHRDLPAKFKSFDSTRLMVWLAWIVSFAVAMLAAVFYAYFQSFSKLGVSSRQDVWGQFGDFVGGTLNPILGFLSLIALVLTVTLQSRQLGIAQAELENSKAELEATREELRKSADAQRQTAAALQEQAKHAVISAQLSALRAALDVTSESLRQFQVAGIFAGPPAMHQHLVDRKEALAAKILGITEKLCGGGAE